MLFMAFISERILNGNSNTNPQKMLFAFEWLHKTRQYAIQKSFYKKTEATHCDKKIYFCSSVNNLNGN